MNLVPYTVRLYRSGRSLDSTLKFPFGLFLAPSIWLGWMLETTLLGTF